MDKDFFYSMMVGMRYNEDTNINLSSVAWDIYLFGRIVLFYLSHRNPLLCFIWACKLAYFAVMIHAIKKDASMQANHSI